MKIPELNKYFLNTMITNSLMVGDYVSYNGIHNKILSLSEEHAILSNYPHERLISQLQIKTI